MENQITSIEAKSLPIEDVDYILESFRFQREPLEHQKRCLLWALERRRVAYWLDIGTGKTLLALYTLMLWGCKKTLVVCPKSVIEGWMDEIKMGLGWKTVALVGKIGDRRRLLGKKARIYLINYEGLQWLWGRRKKNRGRFLPDISKIDELDFDALVIDEAHRCKGHKNLTTVLAREISRRVKHCITMTGTPLTKDQRDLWGEMNVLDLGESLGQNYWGYVRSYFRPWGFDWKLKDGSLEKILKRLAPKTIRYAREDCLDLPERIYERRLVQMSEEQKKLTQAIITGTLETDGSINQTEILNIGIKLAQVAGGSLIQESGTKRLDPNPKVAELLRTLEEVQGKAIIYHQFVEEGRMIEEALEKNDIPACSVRGETKNKPAVISKFLNDPSIKVLVAHPACGGEGLNLQIANTIIFYSNGYNLVHREQSEGRIFRLGQKQSCLYIDLVIEDGMGDSIDKRILKSLKQKSDAATEVLDYIRGYSDESD